MDAGLERIPFTRDDLSVVQNFFCGQDEWALYVANWIRGEPGGVLEALDEGTEVWLYLDERDDIVGYGSLGLTTWLYPNPYEKDGARARLAVIPAFAIQARHQGLPRGDWRQHYSSVIFSDLIELARDRYTSHAFPDPLLGLFVDVRNMRASEFYARHGLANYGKPIQTKASNVRNQRMIVSLLEHSSTPARVEASSETGKPSVTSTTPPVPTEPIRTFEEAVATVLNAPPTLEQQAKKAARKARAAARTKGQKQPKSEPSPPQ